MRRVQLAGFSPPLAAPRDLLRLASDVRILGQLRPLIPAGRVALAAGLALIILLGLARLILGFSPLFLGGLACLGACAWQARLAPEERPVWIALSAGCAALF